MTGRRNFSSSPIYRAAYSNEEHYAELAMRCRKQDLGARDGHDRRATERIRMNHELRRLDDLSYHASFPTTTRRESP